MLLHTANSLRQALAADGPARPPASWYYGATIADIAKHPRRIFIDGEPIVLFATASGQFRALGAQCVHMGADLSRGCVDGEAIRCPFHEWAFDGATGRCSHIPASESIPSFARQAAFPTAIVGRHLFVFNRSAAHFAMPMFADASRLISASPFVIDIDMDWSMVAANGFDVQHFRAAHDRTLVGEPKIDEPTPFSKRIRATFDVTGSSWRDRLTRYFSGPRVTMTVTSFCGTIVLVEAAFARTTTYGMVCIEPLAPGRSRLRTIISIEKRNGIRSLVDPLDVRIRRAFIRAFLQPDCDRSPGIRYSRGTLIEADHALATYFEWLERITRLTAAADFDPQDREAYE